MNINLNEPAPKVAEELIKKFRQRTSVVIDPDEEDEEWQKSENYWASQQAELAVELMLMVCPKYEPFTELEATKAVSGIREASNHTKLTEVLEILKRK